jgi:hypothetical protein
MVSAFVFAAQVVLLAAIMVLFATWLQALLVPQMMETGVASLTPASFHYAKCNVIFVHTPFSHYFPSPGLLVPEGNLEWKKHSCLLSSYLGIIFYHLSCLLLASCLMIFLAAFLIMSLFLMDLFYYFWLCMVDWLAKE